MDLTCLHLKDLKYLQALARTQHFGKAASLCHVTQPTLSAQIKKIEEQLGINLFERTSRSFLLTDIGK